MKKQKILSVPFHNFDSYDGLIKSINRKLNNIIKKKSDSKIILSFANPEMVVEAQSNGFLKTYLDGCDYVLADGIGVVWGSKMVHDKGSRITERLTGTDFVPEIAKWCADNNYKLYMLGGDAETARAAKENLKAWLPALKVESHNGYIHDTEDVITKINESYSDVLMVCMGVPLQEYFIRKYYDKLTPKIIFGNGGAMDFLAGKVERAPARMQKMGLEWLWRLGQDVSWKRIKRQMRLPLYGWLVIMEKLTKENK